MIRKRARVIGLLAMVVATGFGVATSSPAIAGPVAPSGAVSGDLSGKSRCVHRFTLTGTEAMRPDGKTQAAEANDGLGRVYYYQGPKGEISEVIPPAGWSPLHATDSELASYGIPPRPHDSAALAGWNIHMAEWIRPSIS